MVVYQNRKKYKPCKRIEIRILRHSSDKKEFAMDNSFGQKRIISLNSELRLDPILIECFDKSQPDLTQSAEQAKSKTQIMLQNRIIKLNDCVPVNPKNSREIFVKWTEVPGKNESFKHVDMRKQVIVKWSDKTQERTKQKSPKNLLPKPVSTNTRSNNTNCNKVFKKNLTSTSKKPNKIKEKTKKILPNNVQPKPVMTSTQSNNTSSNSVFKKNLTGASKKPNKIKEKTKKILPNNVQPKPVMTSIQSSNTTSNNIFKKNLTDPSKKPDQTFILIPRTAVSSMQGELTQNSIPEKISIDLTSKVPVTFKEISLESLKPKPSQLSTAIQKVFNIQKSQHCTQQQRPTLDNSKPFVLKVKPVKLKNINGQKKLVTAQKNIVLKSNLGNVAQKSTIKFPTNIVKVENKKSIVLEKKDPEIYPVSLAPSESSDFEYLNAGMEEENEMQILGI